MFHLDPASASPPTVQMDETAAVVEALLNLSYFPLSKTMVSILEAIVKPQAERRCKGRIRMSSRESFG